MVGSLDEQDPRGARVDRAELAMHGVACELGDLPRHLDAGRAGADDDEREPGCARRSGSVSASAASNALRRRLRTTSALSSDFTSAACSRQLS